MIAPNPHPALGARVWELRMECRAQRTRLHLIASLQALSLTWLHWTDELRQWTRAHNRKKWILITAFSGGHWSWLLAGASRSHGWIKRQGLYLGPFIRQEQDEVPQIHREPYYCRELVLMISLVISVCFLPVTDTHGITFFHLFIPAVLQRQTSAS